MRSGVIDGSCVIDCAVARLYALDSSTSPRNRNAAGVPHHHSAFHTGRLADPPKLKSRPTQSSRHIFDIQKRANRLLDALITTMSVHIVLGSYRRHTSNKEVPVLFQQ